MRKEHIQLLLLCFAPALPAVLLGIVLLYREPNATDLFVALVAAACAVAGSIVLKRVLDRRVFEPVEHLAKEISTLAPGIPVATRPQLLEHMVIALEQRMARLGETYRDPIENLQEENAHLLNLVGELRGAADGLKTATVAEQEREEHDSRYRSAVALATGAPLADVIADVNILTAEDAPDAPRLTRVTNRARRLAFLVRELEEFDYAADEASRFDVRQLTDEAVAAIMPVLPAPARILTFYDEYGPKRFIGNAAMIKALVFHYLLANALHTDSAGLDLHVRCLADGRLAIVLSPLVPPGADLRHGRLVRLMAPLDASVKDGILSVPLTVDDHYTQPHTGLRAMIVARDEQEQTCIAARLAGMRVDVTQDYDADLCLATIDDVDEIIGLRDKLRSDAKLLLFGNTTPMPLPGTSELDYPPMHDELAAELYEAADLHRARAPLVLAVDGNAANLNLLSLTLSELGVNVETATSGATAVALARRHTFALVLLDLHLPDASGVDVAQAIRRDNGAETPIVMLTAHLGEAEKNRMQEAGITDILYKPATRERLAQLLAALAPVPQVHRPALTANRTTLLSVFDRDLCLKLANNRADLADEILEDMAATLPAERDTINACFTAGDTVAFRESIHRLHDAMQYCGLPRLKNAISKLDAIAGGGREQEIRLALSVFNAEAEALLAWYDPGAHYFDTSLLRGGAA